MILNVHYLTFNDEMFNVGRDSGRPSNPTPHLAVCWGGVGSAVNNRTLISRDLSAGVWLSGRATGGACGRRWAPP